MTDVGDRKMKNVINNKKVRYSNQVAPHYNNPYKRNEEDFRLDPVQIQPGPIKPYKPRNKQPHQWEKKNANFDIYAPNDSDLEDIDDLHYGRAYGYKPQPKPKLRYYTENEESRRPERVFKRRNSRDGRRRWNDDRGGYYSDDSRYSDYRDRRDDGPRRKRKDSLDEYVENEIAHYMNQERDREARERER